MSRRCRFAWGLSEKKQSHITVHDYLMEFRCPREEKCHFSRLKIDLEECIDGSSPVPVTTVV